MTDHVVAVARRAGIVMVAESMGHATAASVVTAGYPAVVGQDMWWQG
jgi:hypothetical protein